MFAALKRRRRRALNNIHSRDAEQIRRRAAWVEDGRELVRS